jgi:hypothetical protein
MSRFEVPTADNALLGFLLAVLGTVSGVAVFIYWLLQPTVLVNAGVETIAKSRPSAIILQSSDFDIETSAVAFARQENEKQGLRSQSVETEKRMPQAGTVAQAPPPKPSVRKRVARSEPHEVGWSFDRRSAWAFGQPARGNAPFGGFGSWFR